MKRGDHDRARILDYLRMCGVFANQTLRNHWNMRPDCASEMIGQFIKAGLVRRVGRGRYIVTGDKYVLHKA